MASNDLWTPGQQCWMDSNAVNMISGCGELNESCYKCGWNPSVHQHRVETIRHMSRKELAELFMDCASGVAWRETNEVD